MTTTEIDYAVNFLAVTMKERLLTATDTQISSLREKLTELLRERFENHWYPQKPLKGSAFRCINISIDDNSVDQVLRRAVTESEITIEDLLAVFPKGLALWIDPNDVSCRLGKGAIFPIYKKIAYKTQRVSSPTNTGIRSHRPQQRPRSITPPQISVPVTQQLQISRSTTPPGFSSMDAGQMFQSIPTSTSYQANNLHKVWNSIPNTTDYETSVQPSTPPTQSYGASDSVYSFNQYSSYYKPSTSYWKKPVKQQQKPIWQSDEVYQRYHWAQNEGAKSFSPNNQMSVNNNYGYGQWRHVQEVC